MARIVELNAGLDVASPSDRGIGTAQNAAAEVSRTSRDSGRVIGGAISQVGGQFGHQLDRENFQRMQESERHQAAQMIGHGSAVSTKLYADMTAQLNEAMSKSDPNDTSVGNGFRTKALEPALENFQSQYATAPEAAQKWAQQTVLNMREHFNKTIIADEMTRASSAVHQNLRDTAINLTVSADLNPAGLDDYIKQMQVTKDYLVESHALGATQASVIDAEAKKLEATMAMSAIKGIARKDPEAAKAALAEGKYNKYLDALQQDQMEKYVDQVGKAAKADERRDKLEAKQEKIELSQDTAEKYMTSLYDAKTGRMQRPDPKLNQKIMDDPNMLPREKTAVIRWNQTQYAAQVREDKASAAGAAAKDNGPLLSDLRARVNSVENPLTRQEVVDALSGEQITRKSAADLMWRVGQQDAAWQAVQRPFQHQFATIKHAISSSIDGQIDPAATAQRINNIEADAQRTLRSLYDKGDQAAIRDALDPKSKNYILAPEIVNPARGNPKATIAQQAAQMRGGAPAPTAINPTTGEKVIFKDGKWQKQ